jgi:outer membrane protein
MRKDDSRGIWLFTLVVALGAVTQAEAQTPRPTTAIQPRVLGAEDTSLPPLPDVLPSQATNRVREPSISQNLASPNSAIGTTNSSPGTTLSGAIFSALNANPDLVSAAERIQIADATLKRARAEFYPKLTLTEAYLGTNIAGLAFFLEVNQRRVNLSQNFNHPGYVGNISTLLTFQQNLYSGGRRTAEALTAEEQRRASSYALAAVRNELVFRVAEAYFRIIQARELVESRSAAVGQIERHVALVRSRYDNGTAVRSDVLSVEVKLAEAKEGLITATNQLELTWAILENVTGCNLPHELPPQGEPAPWAARINAVESAIAEALGRRPELGASLSEVRGAAHKVEAARSGKRASVDFIANFSTFDMNRNSGGNGGFVGLIASINLFDGHRTKADVARASARVRELQAQHKRLLMDIELEVRQAYLALREAEGRLSVSGQAVTQADQSQREIEDRYNDQKATITQLIDAQVASTGARVRRANAAADVEIARAGLQRVVGQLDQILVR